MAKSLVIVESPAKAKTISKYLGKDFIVKASVGHIIDLPKSKIGVDVEHDFKPEYVSIKGKSKIVKELRDASKKVDTIYLAPDPDREGEAIAWHIAQDLKKTLKKTDGEKKIVRVLFNEVTKKGILEAIKNPTELDQNRFEAQQTRRILDRLVGYKVSPVLWEKVRRGLSAGRVQSVAVRLIVEREREIKAFNPVEFWHVYGDFSVNKSKIFRAKLIKKEGKKLVLSNEKETNVVLKDLEKAKYEIEDVIKKERKNNPKPPFITSSLQQDASSKLSYSAKKTMMVAQKLYEGISIGKEGLQGLITYMRTDSTRVSNDAIISVRELIEKDFGKNFLPAKPNFYKSKKGAQDAHEAIRPTEVMRTPASIKQYLTSEQFKVYSLVWKRFVASQMTPALFDQTKIIIRGDGNFDFQATGSIMKFPGFTKVYEAAIIEVKKKEDETEEDSSAILPDVEKGQEAENKKIESEQNFTSPPSRFSEARLVKELEERGIGRPSTYAAIISTIQDREYIVKDKSQLVPTELGFTVTDLLVDNFSKILDAKFTANMEEDLDKIENGELNWLKVMEDFYTPFAKDLEKAKKSMKNLKAQAEVTDIKCSKCEAMMVIKWGRKGQFLACSAYPDCKNTTDFEKDENGKITIVERKIEVMGTCPNCGKDMVLKVGRFGRFLACTGYPDCKTTKPYSLGIKCPEEDCKGDVVEKRTKKGRVFYGCSNYPKCEYASWTMPKKEEDEEEESK